jgi:hypothetical protein
LTGKDKQIMGLYDFTFYDLIDRNAVCYKKKPAWFEVDDDGASTFFEYKAAVDRLAFGLQKEKQPRVLSSIRRCRGIRGHRAAHQLATFGR